LNLAKIYQTDKYDHGYINFYYEKLKSFVNCEFNLLEIGVQWGASIKMWNDFFINANIYAADNFLGINGNGSKFDNPLKLISDVNIFNLNRINIIHLDQSSDYELINFNSKLINTKFKVIIDDGSHLMKDQQITFFHLFDLIESGGYYIIENLQTYNHDGYDVLPDKSNSTKLMLETIISKNILKSCYFDDSDKSTIILSNIKLIEFHYFDDNSEIAIIYKK
jgi:hypothetical protein